MNEVNRVKWARLRKILQNLEEPKNIEEIEKFVFTNPSKKNRRTLNNYLAELEAIGDIDYDATTQTYQKKGIRNRVFNSKHDFEYQLDHSKKLTQRLKTNPYFVLDLLAFASEEEDVEAFHLLKHIKTAYREIYTLIEKYRKKMIDAGLADYDGYPKPILSYEFPVPPPKGPIPRRLPMMLPEPDKETVLREQKEREKAQKWDNDPKIKELVDLRDVIVGKLAFLNYKVTTHNNLLDGVCNLCPTSAVTIKDED